MPRPATRWLALVLCCLLALTACHGITDGTGEVAPADLAVAGDSHGGFDTEAKNAIADVEQFWRANYPSVDNGAALPPLKGKLYSVDGAAVVATHQSPAPARDNRCLQRRLTFIVDNAAYCQLDDSIIWDRGEGHLLPVLTADYGQTLTALIFAHEFGHAIQHRLGSDQRAQLQIYQLESQADCAAGAFAAWALAGKAPHFHFDAAQLDDALDGYFQVRDQTPDSESDVSHGNGFDRLNALQQGIAHGAAYCYRDSYLSGVRLTERPFESTADYGQGGNEPLADLLSPSNITTDLNRFWTGAGKTVDKTFRAVRMSEADHPKCGTETSTSEFGYCPDDNTVYYSQDFADRTYHSITAPQINRSTARVTVERNLPADYALGELIAVAWGMAARHQFFGGSVTGTDALRAAVCYSGAYAEDINRSTSDATHPYVMSPPDMDEATFAVLKLVGLDEAFGARGTTGLQRVQLFVTGYQHGLSAC